MREILIKAKVANAGYWRTGHPVHEWQGEKGYVLEGLQDIESVNQYRISEGTACQFTGLEDSKKNKIFENDIVEIAYEGETPTKWVVYFNKIMGMYRLKMFSGNGERNVFPLNERAVIVGNINDLK